MYTSGWVWCGCEKTITIWKQQIVFFIFFSSSYSFFGKSQQQQCGISDWHCMSNTGTANRAGGWVAKGKDKQKKQKMNEFRIKDGSLTILSKQPFNAVVCDVDDDTTSIHSHRIIKHPHRRSSSTPLSDYTLRLITRWSTAFPVLFTLVAAPAPTGRLPVIIWVDARPYRMSFFNCIVSRWRDESTSPRYRHNSGGSPNSLCICFLFWLFLNYWWIRWGGKKTTLVVYYIWLPLCCIVWMGILWKTLLTSCFFFWPYC